MEHLEEFGEVVTSAFGIKVYLRIISSTFLNLPLFIIMSIRLELFVIVKQVTNFYKVYEDHIGMLNIFDNRKLPWSTFFNHLKPLAS